MGVESENIGKISKSRRYDNGSNLCDNGSIMFCTSSKQKYF
jgi:hypothetical protein